MPVRALPPRRERAPLSGGLEDLVTKELCVWCSKEVKPEDQQAKRGDLVWHANCFVKYLAHCDEIRGITR